MKSCIHKILVLTAIFALLSGPVLAAQLTGVILDTKDVQVKNKDSMNKVLLLKTQNDRVIVADLGPAKDLQDFTFEKDQQVQLEGNTARVGSRPVLIVTRANIGGRDFQVQRTDQAQKGMHAKKDADVKKIKGQITHEKTVSIKGQDQSHKVVMLKTEKGNQIVADLGPEDKLQDLQLQKGKELEVQGRLARVSDHLLLVANKVQADGKSVDIQRMQRQGQPQTQAQDGGSEG